MPYPDSSAASELPSDIVQVAARTIRERMSQPVGPEGIVIADVFARAALAAVIPLIREQIARDILALKLAGVDDLERGWNSALLATAGAARGEQS